jgi:diguanylate cyclase (GGDEF)-like protein
LCVEVDPIAQIGDLYGQAIEDEVMKNLSQELNKQVGKFGLLAKRATNQFCFFLPDGDNNKIVEICRNIIKVFNEQFYNKRYNVNLSPFIGIVKFPQDTRNRDDLLRFASVAMREAKNENINVLNFSDITRVKDDGKIATLRT